MNLSKINKIYFIGIGGIGVSALARLMLEFNKQVFGSDIYDSSIITDLEKLGAKIKIGPHQAGNFNKEIDLVIFTSALKLNNPELKKAKKLKIPTFSYPEFLAQLMNGYIPLVVSGTHGKSTTTAMLAKIFIEAGLDPSVVVGTNIKELNGNARLGLGRHFIVEGDEYRAAFLNYKSVGLIINNIEADHLDYYKNIENIVKTFRQAVKKVPRGGFLVANAQDNNVKKILKSAKCKVISFGIEEGDYYASHIVQRGELTCFAVKGLERFDLAIKIPGLHNVQNALAATVLALAFQIDCQVIKKALLNFQGAWRRFEIKGEKKGIIVVDDYAHHPTEIKATLKTAKKYFSAKKIWCVYQPHSGPRTKTLFNDFINSFTDCDELIVTDIYQVAGREKKEKVDIKAFVKAIKKEKKEITLVKDYKCVCSYLISKLKPGDVVITMGAGTITEISDELLEKI